VSVAQAGEAIGEDLLDSMLKRGVQCRLKCRDLSRIGFLGQKFYGVGSCKPAMEGRINKLLSSGMLIGLGRDKIFFQESLENMSLAVLSLLGLAKWIETCRRLREAR
jgi:hypothetical protein